ALEITVGLFVAFAIVAFTALAFQVSGLTTLYEPDKGYQITSFFEEIGGLKTRSRVTIAGVQIGRVDSISLDPTSFSARVELQIFSDFKNLIPIDSSASIVTAGLIGDNYIVIEPGAELDTIQAGGAIEETHSAIILERLIGQLIFNQNDDEDPDQ
ncbi:MAG TPA: outer membrane lipid asymmetry maintenance protein MlaD, partial [Gammaproteobacteria bacterium]|nr:outer membrane lipid asymmetry maintenance protein MlaD [Gammaproteobacteria bacterium]